MMPYHGNNSKDAAVPIRRHLSIRSTSPHVAHTQQHPTAALPAEPNTPTMPTFIEYLRVHVQPAQTLQ
jgi:hypothetical protein